MLAAAGKALKKNPQSCSLQSLSDVYDVYVVYHTNT